LCINTIIITFTVATASTVDLQSVLG